MDWSSPCRRSRDYRGSNPAEHAVCPGQECRLASCSYAASHAGAPDPAADDAGKCVSGASCRVRDRGRARDQTRTALRSLVVQLVDLRLQIKTIEKKLLAWHRTTQESRRLETIPGVGFITATAIATTVTDASYIRSSREFSAWLGLTPRQNSSGGKDRLGRISKMGNGYLRSLIVVGATAMIRYAREKGAVSARWINALLAKKPARLVSVAVANKTARIAWALLVRKQDYRVPVPVAA